MIENAPLNEEKTHPPDNAKPINTIKVLVDSKLNKTVLDLAVEFFSEHFFDEEDPIRIAHTLISFNNLLDVDTEKFAALFSEDLFNFLLHTLTLEPHYIWANGFQVIEHIIKINPELTNFFLENSIIQLIIQRIPTVQAFSLLCKILENSDEAVEMAKEKNILSSIIFLIPRFPLEKYFTQVMPYVLLMIKIIGIPNELYPIILSHLQSNQYYVNYFMKIISENVDSFAPYIAALPEGYFLQIFTEFQCPKFKRGVQRQDFLLMIANLIENSTLVDFLYREQAWTIALFAIRSWQTKTYLPALKIINSLLLRSTEFLEVIDSDYFDECVNGAIELLNDEGDASSLEVAYSTLNVLLNTMNETCLNVVDQHEPEDYIGALLESPDGFVCHQTLNLILELLNKVKANSVLVQHKSVQKAIDYLSSSDCCERIGTFEMIESVSFPSCSDEIKCEIQEMASHCLDIIESL